jgi:hypothetical protein
MSASDQTIADNARDALNRILQTDTTEWSEGERRQSMLEIDRLEDIITKFEAKAPAPPAAASFHRSCP